MKILHYKKAVSTIEILAVITLLLAALLGFSGYIKNALSGRWKSVGETFGQGRQYDPRGFGTAGESGGTMDCFFDQILNIWVDENLYRTNNCDCTTIRGEGVALPEYAVQCIACKQSSLCAQPPT